MGKAKVIIGIPIHNDLESLRENIKSIYNTTEFPFEIVLVESNSIDGCKDYCNYLSLIYPNIRHLEVNTKTPLEAYNYLFELAIKEEKDLLLSQTDIIYHKLYKNDWLKWLYTLSHVDGVSISTSLNGGGFSGEDYIKGFYWVGGWCTYIPFKTLKELKGFDINFPNGYGVDIDFSYRASKLGNIMRIEYYP